MQPTGIEAHKVNPRSCGVFKLIRKTLTTEVTMTPVLELRGITKRFPGVLANDNIDLTLNKGEILALLGENGAGKTTLMNILYGLYKPDKGEVFVRGEKLEVEEPSDAIHAGVGMVHQHFMLIPVFTVTENVMLGYENVYPGGFLDRKSAAVRIREISAKYHLEVNPDAYVRDLPVGVQQRVEIIKLLYREADILILDEPSAVLTPQEVDELFKIMRSLTAQGKSIIFITHKLGEVLEVADRITVIRGGKVVGTTTPAEANKRTLASMMVGREVDLEVNKKPANPGEVVLDVKNLKCVDNRDHIVVNGVSFEVRTGEILGIAGVQGNGQTELVKAITALHEAVGGEIRILGKPVTHSSPREITEVGTAHIPEDRQLDGLVLAYPVMDNLVL
ncbi:MAG: ABC transporter ATP-binding protein, partial [Anaerolineaceae bacterium]|nr:ABC transporter ATP-binding protein [Anaerolineaceae bacterium]